MTNPDPLSTVTVQFAFANGYVYTSTVANSASILVDVAHLLAIPQGFCGKVRVLSGIPVTATVVAGWAPQC